jgi:hypothetical protein
VFMTNGTYPWSFVTPCNCGESKQRVKEFEDTKGVIWSRISKKNKQHNGKKKKDKRSNKIYKTYT